MAEGYQNVIENPENKSITLASGFALQSWGYISAIKLGHLILIQGSGIYSTNDITTLTEFGTVNGITLTATTIGIVVCNDKVYNIQAWAGGTNMIRISAGVPANTNFNFLIVGFCY